MYTTMTRLRKSFHWNRNLIVYFLTILIINQFIVETWQQILLEHPDSASKQQQNVEINYQQGDQHNIVKRKLKMKSILGGKSKSKPKTKPHSNSYPKQPAYNPSYGSSNPYPKQPSHNPNYPGANAPPSYPGSSHSAGYPAGPPPAYPGLNTGRSSYPQQSNYPRYPQQSSNYPMQNPGYPGYQNKPFGGGNTFGHSYGNNYGGGFGGGHYRKSKGLNIGRSIGTAGFGALAGTALGAYGGYKLGRMVGNLGRMGHYGYYSDQGRYIRCEPPRNIKIDPETNISYIPLEDSYDRRCSYFDRPPPTMIEPSMLISAANTINNLFSFINLFFLIFFIQSLLYLMRKERLNF